MEFARYGIALHAVRRQEIGLMKFAFAAVFALIASGCGGPSKPSVPLVQVSGTVKYAGAPVTKGTIFFAPETDGGTPYSGVIDSNGRYSMAFSADHKGIPAGNYRISVIAKEPDSMDPMGVPIIGKSQIPDKYASPDTSETIATVEKKGSVTLDFDLKQVD